MAKQTGVIYKITNPKGKIYIGQSINFSSRKRKYKSLACGMQPKLYNSFIKYGYINHVIEIICKIDSESLNTMERYYQELYNCVDNGLNCRLTCTDDKSGSMSNESVNKMRNARLGKKATEETKAKMSESTKGFSHSKESRIKISKSKFNISDKTRKLLSEKKSKLILDIETGVYYYSANELSKLLGVKRTTLTSKLSGQNKNNTNYKYV